MEKDTGLEESLGDSIGNPKKFSNSNFKRGNQVRGVVYIDFILVMIECALYG